VQLPSVLAERPRRNDALLADVRHPVHPCGHAPEHDVPSALGADGIGTGTVDRSPDELRAALDQRGRRGVQRLTPGDEPDANLEPVVPHAADVALAKLRRPLAEVTLACFVGVRHGDRIRRLDLDGCRPRFGHDRVLVEEADVPVDPLHA
jgi:hypothetical protein